jgi:protein gp37
MPTNIEWTDETWNPITGCSIKSPGCRGCYAMQLAATRLKHHPSRAGLTHEVNGHHVWTGEVRFNEQWLDQPLKWRRPRMIFVCAHGDLFHEDVPDEWIDRVFAVMALAPQHTFQVLTKRSDRMRAYLGADRLPVRWANDGEIAARIASTALDSFRNAGRIYQAGFPLPNVWLGVSVEDQVRADERIPDLLATPATVRFLSCEPLLGPIALTRIHETWLEEGGGRTDAWESCLNGKRFDEWGDGDIEGCPKVDWVICGGESGPRARPMHPDWARSLRDQCAAAGVPFFFKQWGAWGPDTGPGGDVDRTGLPRDRIMEGAGPCAVLVDQSWRHFADGYEPPIELCSGHAEFVYRLGKSRNGRLLDGVTHDGLPA